MHIGIDARMIGPERYGGIGRYLSNLVEHLLEEPGVQYTLFFSGTNEAALSRNGFRVSSLEAPIYSFREQFLFPLMVRRQRLDLLHLPHYNAPVFASCPLVVTVHDTTHLRFPPSRRAYWYARLMLWAVCQRARCIITPSQVTAKELQQRFPFVQGKVHVVPHGVEARFRPLEDRAAVDRYRCSCGLPGTFILYVGGTSGHKGLPRLVRAFARIRRRGVAPDCKLVIASHELPPKDRRLLPAIRQEGLEGEVVFLGPVPDRELPLLYNAATVLAFPSHNEGFGLPPLEALACGTPVACSDAGSLPEVLGDAALLVPGDDQEGMALALERLLAEPVLRFDLRTRGIQRARHFSWETAARRTLEVYRNALEEQGER